MDINGVLAQLAGLGVTLTDEDDPPALAPQLLAERRYRASLTLQFLTGTRAFLDGLNSPLPGGLGTDFPFVATALADPELLNDLALSLDHWLCPALEHAMDTAMGRVAPPPPTTYNGYFNSEIFDPVLATYNAHVTAFLNSYPITANALTQITNNFQQNILTACRRILTDRPRIVNLFLDEYTNGLTIRSLQKIKSTGSDFHKGGQQVLVLTFEIGLLGGWWPKSDELKLVYKPADLELDCLIAGNSVAANRAVGAVPAFMGQSLIEIFNATALANPAAGLVPLPTYRILPRNNTSGQAGPNVNVRAAYGYIEYLGYSLTGMSFAVGNYYPMGASDYVIFQSEDEDTVIERFYHQIGQWLALAVTFSLQDLHVENVRASKYQANLIDLEYSLTNSIANLTQTLLFFSLMGVATGGINAYSRDNEDYVWTFVAGTTGLPPRPQYLLDQNFITKTYQNRLFAMKPTKRLVRVNAFWLLEGLTNGMNTLQHAEAANAFLPWFNRLANVLVRIIPVPTSDWNTARFGSYVNDVQTQPAPAPLLASLTSRLRDNGSMALNAYNVAPTPEPKFLGWFSAQALTDLQNFDIPVFYSRVGTTDVLDSMGVVIAVPAQVTVWAPGGPPATVLANTNVGRATYFAAAPTGPRVQVGQVAALTGAGFAGTLAQWQNQVLNQMGLLAPPANPGVLLH